MPLARLSGINISYQVEGQGEPLVMIMGLTAGLIGMVSLEFPVHLAWLVTYENTKFFLRPRYFGDYIILRIFHAAQCIFQPPTAIR